MYKIYLIWCHPTWQWHSPWSNLQEIWFYWHPSPATILLISSLFHSSWRIKEYSISNILEKEKWISSFHPFRNDIMIILITFCRGRGSTPRPKVWWTESCCPGCLLQCPRHPTPRLRAWCWTSAAPSPQLPYQQPYSGGHTFSALRMAFTRKYRRFKSYSFVLLVWCLQRKLQTW